MFNRRMSQFYPRLFLVQNKIMPLYLWSSLPMLLSLGRGGGEWGCREGELSRYSRSGLMLPSRAWSSPAHHKCRFSGRSPSVLESHITNRCYSVVIGLFLIEVQLIYNVVLVHGYSKVIYIYIYVYTHTDTYIFFFIFFSIIGYYKILNVL